MSGFQPTIRVSADDFVVGDEIARLTRGRTDIGAIVTFSGLCRDEGGTLAALELEHYPGMAQAELRRIAGEAMARWPLTGLTVLHRHGRIEPGANIVLVAAAAAHRQAAFDAASFLMDYLKSSAPFWKKEHRLDGLAGAWVEASSRDDAALSRWDVR